MGELKWGKNGINIYLLFDGYWVIFKGDIYKFGWLSSTYFLIDLIPKAMRDKRGSLVINLVETANGFSIV